MSWSLNGPSWVRCLILCIFLSATLGLEWHYRFFESVASRWKCQLTNATTVEQTPPVQNPQPFHVIVPFSAFKKQCKN